MNINRLICLVSLLSLAFGGVMPAQAAWVPVQTTRAEPPTAFPLTLDVAMLSASSDWTNTLSLLPVPAAPGQVIQVPGDYATIGAALAVAQASDIVQVAAGNYLEGSLTIPAGVQLIGAGWQTTTIDGNSASVVIYGSPNASIEGFTIRGSSFGYFDAGIWISSGSLTIRSTRLTGNAAGIWAWCFDPTTCNIHVTVTDSLIDQNLSNGVNSNEYAVFTLERNTIVKNGGSGVILNNASSLAQNNLIVANQGDGLVNNVGAAVQYNDVWHNNRDYVGGSIGGGGLSVDPLFHDLDHGDYDLYAGAPIIGAGTPAGTDMGALPFMPVGTAPANVTLAQTGEKSWELSWTDASAAGYYIYYGSCTRQTTIITDVGAVLTFQLSNLSPDDISYAAVSAYDLNKKESEATLANGIHVPCPLTPANLEAGAFPGGKIRLQWQDMSAIEDGFKIERGMGVTYTNEYVEIISLPPNTTVYTDIPPVMEGTFWYRIRAYNANGASPYSNKSYNATFMSVPDLDEQYLLVLINEARADPGVYGYPDITPVAPLAYNPLLNYAAHSHSQAILNSGYQIGHCDLIGRCPTERAHAVGYEGGVGENLIIGQTGPAWVESSHQAFMDSEGHRNNLLAASFNEAGLGHTYDPNKGDQYWKGQYTETFCGRSGVNIPNLPSGIVIPYDGTVTTSFDYIVNYYHPQGLAPDQATVYIDDLPHTMTLRSGAAHNGTYQYTTQLPAGEHHYYFAFTFPGGSARLPDIGSYPYPLMGYVLSGHIRDDRAEPLEGVTVFSSSGAAVTSAADGSYTFNDVQPGTYTITPTLAGYTFDPPIHTVSIPPNATGQDFTAYGPPQAAFEGSPLSGPAPLTVYFTNTSTGSYTSSQWDFGDGATSAQENPTHAYTAEGTYAVTLTVGGQGGTDFIKKANYITVYPPLRAGFTGAPTSGLAPLTVAFTNTSTGSYTSSLWDFGDGATSAQENPTHTYTAHGAYTVTLTVSGPSGLDTKISSGYIYVARPSPALGRWQCWDPGSANPCHHSLQDVAMLSASDGWAVGIGGTILHWNGSVWSQDASPTTGYLSAIAMLSATDGWAVGYGGTILHWDGSAWVTTTSPTTRTLTAVAVTSPSDGWAVGYGGTILHWNGSIWSQVASPTANDLSAVAMLSVSDGWAVGYGGTILHWDGSAWTPVPSPTPWEVLGDIAMLTPSDGWAVGGSGSDSIILHWDGNTWLQVPSPAASMRNAAGVLSPSAGSIRKAPSGGEVIALSALSMLSSSDGWAVGGAGTLHWDGSTWSRSAGPAATSLSGIAMLSPNDGWVVGYGGAILHWDGSAWREAVSPMTKFLRGIAMPLSSDGWVGGDALLHWDGRAWGQVASPTVNGINAIAMLSPSDGWAVGRSGTILHWNDSAWIPVTSPTTHTLTALTMLSPSDGWAVGGDWGGSSTILHWNGSAWINVDSPTTTVLNGIAMLSPSDGWAVGGDWGISSTILHWDGSTWSEVSSPANMELYGVTMLSPNDAWAVGWDILHWDGSTWSKVTSPKTDYLTSIAMLSSDDGWAVGGGGTILYWDGSTWSEATSPSAWSLYGVAMLSPSEGWAAGFGGAILRYAPVYTILGQVTDHNARPLPGVTIQSNAGSSVLTDINGFYTFTGVYSGTYILTPTLDGYNFNPPARTISVPPDAGGQDFTTYAPLQAAFEGSPLAGVAPLTVVFTNTSTGNYTSSSWDFGDGAASTQENAVRIYAQPGSYTVTLTVNGPGGTDSLKKASYITVYAPPQAAFYGAPTSGLVPLTVFFTNTSTGSYTGSLWDFGDGTTSILNSPVHTFIAKGAYTVTLTVYGSSGNNTVQKRDYIRAGLAPGSGHIYLPLARKDKVNLPVTINVTLQANDQDGYDDGAAFYLSGDGSKVNWVGGSNQLGWVFPQVKIPAGVVITGAAVRFRGFGTGQAAAHVAGFAEDNAAFFDPGGGNRPSLRPATAAAVTWNADRSFTWQWLQTPDLSTILQEIINRPGWVSGGNLGLKISNPDGGQPWAATDFAAGLYSDANSGGHSVTLTVTYIAP